ncbi:hypothetical protein cypCar_00010444 [Cyprinus carpio]|nr:hypothetical protein cypCar_00010444 [Cyprinus carpio]
MRWLAELEMNFNAELASEYNTDRSPSLLCAVKREKQLNSFIQAVMSLPRKFNISESSSLRAKPFGESSSPNLPFKAAMLLKNCRRLHPWYLNIYWEQRKGERLIRFSEMCCKLETEYEKVLPFYTSSLSEEELNQERANAIELPTEKLAQVMSTELKLSPW